MVVSARVQLVYRSEIRPEFARRALLSGVGAALRCHVDVNADQTGCAGRANIDIYTQQIARWRTAKPSAIQASELDRMEKQNQQLRDVTADVLALARELREGTIERVLGMSDLELGLQYLLGKQPSNRG